MKKDGLIRVVVALAVLMVAAFTFSEFTDRSFLNEFVRMGSLFAVFVAVFWIGKKRGKLDLTKSNKHLAACLAVSFAVVAVHTISFKFLEKRFDWFAKTKAEAEAFEGIQKSFDKPIEAMPIAESNQELGEESIVENDEVCCGGEAGEAFVEQVNEAWANPDQADPDLVKLLPSPDIADQAQAFLQSKDQSDQSDPIDHFEQIDHSEHSNHSNHFDSSKHFDSSDPSDSSDLPLAPRDEPEIDWNQTRLEMLAGAEMSHGEVGKALLAETMLEADRFMENMSEADAAAIAKRAQDMWEKQAHRIPEPLISGANAAIWRKTFEMFAAVERMETNEEFREMEEEFAEMDREFEAKMEALGHSSISEEEYMRDYLGMSEDAIAESLARRQAPMRRELFRIERGHEIAPNGEQ